MNTTMCFPLENILPVWSGTVRAGQITYSVNHPAVHREQVTRRKEEGREGKELEMHKTGERDYYYYSLLTEFCDYKKLKVKNHFNKKHYII